MREPIDSGEISGVRNTPTFFIDNEIQDVSFDLQALIDGVEAALRKR